MAYYQDSTVVQKLTNVGFDTIYKPGEVPVHSGIFKCQQCGVEVVAEMSRKLPPTTVCKDHHPSGDKKVGKVTWKLIVYARHQGD